MGAIHTTSSSILPTRLGAPDLLRVGDDRRAAARLVALVQRQTTPSGPWPSACWADWQPPLLTA